MPIPCIFCFGVEIERAIFRSLRSLKVVSGGWINLVAQEVATNALIYRLALRRRITARCCATDYTERTVKLITTGKNVRKLNFPKVRIRKYVEMQIKSSKSQEFWA